MLLQSKNPATGEIVWEGLSATPEEIQKKIESAKFAFRNWSNTTFEYRAALLEKYAHHLKETQSDFAALISQETGKPLWESRAEVASMIGKIPLSIESYLLRCSKFASEHGNTEVITTFRPHGTVAVLGPFNFPGHLPNGHIVPSLLAGNTVLFKPSELTPGSGAFLHQCLIMAGIPKEVIEIVQGGKEVGEEIVKNPNLDGLFFTGSESTGIALNGAFSKTPGKILALELGGNNPLIVSEIDDVKPCAYLTIQSAFITSGQRCTSARRLILPKTKMRERFLEELLDQTKKLKIGPYTDVPEPFMGPLISSLAEVSLLKHQEKLLEKGAKPLLLAEKRHKEFPFVSPGIIDVTEVKNRPDVEIFGPLLQVIFVEDLNEAITLANQTEFGLSAALFSKSKHEWEQFFHQIKAGIINWNTPTTGASSKAPFGGLGKSGNHRPSGYFAADYCSYPIASIQNSQISLPSPLTPGTNG